MRLVLMDDDGETLAEWERVEDWTKLDEDPNYLAIVGDRVLTPIWENLDEEAQGGKQANAPASNQKG